MSLSVKGPPGAPVLAASAAASRMRVQRLCRRACRGVQQQQAVAWVGAGMALAADGGGWHVRKPAAASGARRMRVACMHAPGWRMRACSSQRHAHPPPQTPARLERCTGRPGLPWSDPRGPAGLRSRAGPTHACANARQRACACCACACCLLCSVHAPAARTCAPAPAGASSSAPAAAASSSRMEEARMLAGPFRMLRAIDECVHGRPRPF